MFDDKFEKWFDETFPAVDDPVTRSVASCAWDARWELVMEEFRATREDGER